MNKSLLILALAIMGTIFFIAKTDITEARTFTECPTMPGTIGFFNGVWRGNDIENDVLHTWQFSWVIVRVNISSIERWRIYISDEPIHMGTSNANGDPLFMSSRGEYLDYMQTDAINSGTLNGPTESVTRTASINNTAFICIGGTQKVTKGHYFENDLPITYIDNEPEPDPEPEPPATGGISDERIAKFVGVTFGLAICAYIIKLTRYRNPYV